MKDKKLFANEILLELSSRMSGRKAMININRDMTTLENLLKRQTKTDTQKAVLWERSSSNDSKKQVITVKDLEKLKDIDVLKINPGDIITPSAKDFLKKKRIKLELR
ncbi:MAG: hypothetical protein ACOZCL_19165 [Bacillota bacterium]